MKKKLIYEILISLMILLAIGNVSLASDSSSIPVSCSIPAVPGLNAPPIAEKTTETGVVERDTKIKEEAQEQSPSTIQEDDADKIVLADGKTSTIITQTIYSR
jgi:hypothetical protein